MTDYFVSNEGSDSNTGREGSPWATITRANAAMSTGRVGIFDRLLFRRGDTFFGRIREPDNLNPFGPGWLIVGAYGTGALPKINGYKTILSWTNHATNVWRIDYANSGSGIRYSGYDSAQGEGDVGHLLVAGIVRGTRRTSIAAMVNLWDFYSTGTTLYVFSPTAPASGTVQVAVDGHGVMQRSAVKTQNLAILGHGGHGVQAPGLGGSTRAQVTNNEIYNCGGSALDGYGDGNVRYGNGVEFWVNSHDFVVTDNIIHDVYDVSITLQGGSPGDTQGFTNSKIKRNLSYRSSQGIEFWYGGEGNGFTNVDVDDNFFLFSGYGWGSLVRPEQQTRVSLLTFAWGTSGPRMRNNVHWDAAHAFRYSEEVTPGLQGTDNLIALRPGTLMTHQTTQTIEQAAAWAVADGRETDLRTRILPSSGGYADSDVSAALSTISDLRGSKLVNTPGGVSSLPTVPSLN